VLRTGDPTRNVRDARNDNARGPVPLRMSGRITPLFGKGWSRAGRLRGAPLRFAQLALPENPKGPIALAG
jgi:hypothetical protein